MPSLWNLHVGKFESQPARAPALRLDDGGKLVHGLLHVAVDDEIVVLPPGRDLFARPGEPAGDLDGRVAVALSQPRLELLHGRRHDEHRHGLRVPLAQLPGAVRVDIEQHVEPAAERSLEHLHRRAVVIAVDSGPLREPVLVAHVEEFSLAHEVEIGAVDLARAGQPRRVRNRVEEIRHEPAHLVTERGLARPRGGRNHDQGAAPLDELHLAQHSPHDAGAFGPRPSVGSNFGQRFSSKGHHSMFWACSRSFSRVDLAAMAACESSRSSAFEPTVFTSRFISWIRKSSVRPTAPPSSSSRASSPMCARSRASSSVMSLFSAHIATSVARRASSSGVPPISAWTRSRSRCCLRSVAAGPRAAITPTCSPMAARSARRSLSSAVPSASRRPRSSPSAFSSASWSRGHPSSGDSGVCSSRVMTPGCSSSHWSVGTPPSLSSSPARRASAVYARAWAMLIVRSAAGAPSIGATLTLTSTLPRSIAPWIRRRASSSNAESARGIRSAMSRWRWLRDLHSTDRPRRTPATSARPYPVMLRIIGASTNEWRGRESPIPPTENSPKNLWCQCVWANERLTRRRGQVYSARQFPHRYHGGLPHGT